MNMLGLSAPVISANIWGDEPEAPEQHYYTVQYYNPSGFGTQATYSNILAASSAEACENARSAKGIPMYQKYLLSAFEQKTRIF